MRTGVGPHAVMVLSRQDWSIERGPDNRRSRQIPRSRSGSVPDSGGCSFGSRRRVLRIPGRANGSALGNPQACGTNSTRGTRRFRRKYRSHARTGAVYPFERLRVSVECNTATWQRCTIRSVAISWIIQPIATPPTPPVPWTPPGANAISRCPPPFGAGPTHLNWAVWNSRSTSRSGPILGTSARSLRHQTPRLDMMGESAPLGKSCVNSS